MLATAETWTFDDWSVELQELKDGLVSREAEISRLRAEQIELVRRADRLQADTADGARTMQDWVAATLDVSHQIASRLLHLAQAPDRDLEERMAQGQLGLDRAEPLSRLRAQGADEELVSDSSEYSLGHLFGLWDRLREISRGLEQFGYEDRYLVIQPSLDLSGYKICGRGRLRRPGLAQPAPTVPGRCG